MTELTWIWRRGCKYSESKQRWWSYYLWGLLFADSGFYLPRKEFGWCLESLPDCCRLKLCQLFCKVLEMRSSHFKTPACLCHRCLLTCPNNGATKAANKYQISVCFWWPSCINKSIEKKFCRNVISRYLLYYEHGVYLTTSASSRSQPGREEEQHQ